MSKKVKLISTILSAITISTTLLGSVSAEAITIGNNNQQVSLKEAVDGESIYVKGMGAVTDSTLYVTFQSNCSRTLVVHMTYWNAADEYIGSSNDVVTVVPSSAEQKHYISVRDKVLDNWKKAMMTVTYLDTGDKIYRDYIYR